MTRILRLRVSFDRVLARGIGASAAERASRGAQRPRRVCRPLRPSRFSDWAASDELSVCTVSVATRMVEKRWPPGRPGGERLVPAGSRRTPPAVERRPVMAAHRRPPRRVGKRLDLDHLGGMFRAVSGWTVLRH